MRTSLAALLVLLLTASSLRAQVPPLSPPYLDVEPDGFATLEDIPIIPYNILEAVAPGVFQDDETVEVILGKLSNEDVMRLWETLVQDRFQLSIPYIARNLIIESDRFESVGPFVQERVVY